MTRKFPGFAAAAFLAVALATPLAGQNAAEGFDRYQVGTATPPLDPGRTLIEMTLDEAIERALANNLSLRSQRLAPELQAWSMQASRAAFLPSFTVSSQYNNSSQQATSQLDGGSRTTTERLSLNTSISQPLPWLGARLGASFNNTRNTTDSNNSLRPLSYNASVSLNYTQPLLSGLRVDGQRMALQTQEIQREITDIQLQTQTENLANQVRTSYWALRSAIEQIEIQERSLAQARQLLENNRLRVNLGTLAEIEIVQAESQVASGEQALLNAQIQWRNQELAFRQLLVGGADDPLFNQTVFPVDLPEVAPVTVDIPAAIDRALAGRTDIRQQRQQYEISQLNLRVTEDGKLPDLNLTASYGLSGVGGDEYERTGGLGAPPVLVEESGYTDALRALANRDTPTFSVGVSLSYPLGMRSANAGYERASIQLRQAEIALQNQELAIATEVTNAGLSVENTFLQLEAARRSRAAAERSAEAEIARFTVGASTNYQVVQTQNSLTSALLSELRATINYTNAIAEFERAQTVGR